ncbi:MAG: VOC family protein, partial [Bacteroidota bacterium]
SVGDMEKVAHFFRDYGGWEEVGSYDSHRSVLDFWDLSGTVSAKEILLQSEGLPFGQIRLQKFHGTQPSYIRSSQNPWDTGGIMDINLRVHSVKESFEELREMGWHGLSDPLFQTMGPFKLYDILMKGYDDIIIAFTHRTEPPLQLTAGLNIPSHIYNSSIIVKDLKVAREFYIDQLGFQLLNEYSLRKEKPEENMFGLPFNMADKVTCKAHIVSPDGDRDTLFQIIEFEGVEGKDFSDKAIPPNRGLLLYRCEVEDIQTYFEELQIKRVPIHKPLQPLHIEPYGSVNCFAVRSPNGVWWEFLEKSKN